MRGRLGVAYPAGGGVFCSPLCRKSAKREKQKLHQKRKSQQKQQFVYFVGGGDLVKIGIACDPLKRVDDMQIGSPVILHLLGFYPGGRDKEKSLHRRFMPGRSHGEWFDPKKMLGINYEIVVAEEYMRAHYARAA